jgi:hypothetical protein
MGVDVNLYAESDAPISDERLAEAAAFFTARIGEGDEFFSETLQRDPYPIPGGKPRIEWNTGTRYYGPGYERGYWPTIYAAILTMQAALPECTVYYGGDTTDDGEECTADFLARLWLHFLGPRGRR